MIGKASSTRNALIFHCRHYRFAWIPSRLRNAPGPFHQTVDVILLAVNWPFAFVYFDDNAVFLKSPQEDNIRFRNVLPPFSIAIKTLKLRRWCIFAATLDYLGFVISTERSEIASHTIDAAHKLHASTSFTKLRSSHRLCNIFWQFFPNVARKAALLKKWLQNDHPTDWVLVSKTNIFC